MARRRNKGGKHHLHKPGQRREDYQRLGEVSPHAFTPRNKPSPVLARAAGRQAVLLLRTASAALSTVCLKRAVASSAA